MLSPKTFFAALVCLAALPAHAYTIKNSFASGCHEQITSLALRMVRTEVTTAAPLPVTRDEQALIDDLQFTPDRDMKDLGGVSLLIGVRDNDLKGAGSGDLTELAEIHGDPGDQDQHCLRGANDKEPGGSEAAIIACRAFIRGRIAEALEGLDATGKPDAAIRTSLRLHLSIRSGIDASLPTYYVRMGQAIHALQDSFTHTYRTADGMQVTVALNWLNHVNKTLVESRDGPPHSNALDVCDDSDDLRKRNRELATAASVAVLRATLEPKKTTTQKMAAVDAALSTYLGFKPGCSSDNQWCDAPEATTAATASCGSTGANLGGMASLLVLLALVWRARRPSVILAVALVAGGAQAAEEPAVPAPVVIAVTEPGPRDPSAFAVGGSAAVAASFDKAGLAGSVGVRLRLSKRWSIGTDVEWNPWIALNGTPIRMGVVNFYGLAILRFPLAYENFNLRSSLSFGGSYLLSDFYGAPSGSLGLYFGISPLALEWKASRVFYVVINPASIALPVPHLTGVPFFYPQYRFTIGLEFYSG